MGLGGLPEVESKALDHVGKLWETFLTPPSISSPFPFLIPHMHLGIAGFNTCFPETEKPVVSSRAIVEMRTETSSPKCF